MNIIELLKKWGVRNLLFIGFLTLCLQSHPVSAEWTRTQTIVLTPGWNAVYMEVTPSDPNPDTVFQGKPVEQVLTYYPTLSSVEYIQEPNEIEWKKAGWHRWVQPGSPEAIFKNLYALQANQAYLIRATEDFTLELTGEPRFSIRTWRPDSFNFVGFHVSPDAPPFFADYFKGASAFSDGQIYYLKDNRWTWAGNMNQTAIVPGRAYWVYCRGGSDWNGQFSITLPGTGTEIGFADQFYERKIGLISRSGSPLTVTLTPVPNASGDMTAPLLYITKPLDGSPREYVPISAQGKSFDLQPGTEITVSLAVNPDTITGNEVSSLLKVSGSTGEQYHIPLIYTK